jgi:hypothetical protein
MVRNKDSKKQRTYKEDSKNSSIAGPPGNIPPGVADWSFYSTNKARMQAFFATRSQFHAFNFGNLGNSGSLLMYGR